MLSPKEKYDHALRLRRALNSKKDAEKVVKAEQAILTAYVEQTADKEFRWNSGLTLTYISAVAAKRAPDASVFMEVARDYMSAEDYNAALEKSMREKGARNAYFR